jgi:terminase small subunit / prophage DNA-packing protein
LTEIVNMPTTSASPRVRQADIARHLDLSRTAVSEAVAAGVFQPVEPGRFDLDAARIAYIRHLREVAAGRASADADAPDLVAERARLASAQADAQEMKNAALRGELLPRHDVTAAVQSAFARVRARLLALPAKIAPVVVGATVAQAKDRIEDAVHEALTELAATQVVAVARE